MIKRLKSEAGFTIQELIVVLAVGSLLFIFSNITFTFIQKTYGIWTSKIDHRDEVLRLKFRMIRDVQLAEEIIVVNDTSYIFILTNEDTIKYIVFGNQIIRNNTTLNNSDSLLLKITIFSDGATSKQNIGLEFIAKSNYTNAEKFTVENLHAEKQRFVTME